MMRVVAAQIVDVHRRQRMIGKTLEKLMRQVDIEPADHRARKRYVPFESGPAR